MVRQHSSFLVRCWHLGSGDERIAIEHIQSGAKTLVRSLPDAVAWIEGHRQTGDQAVPDSEASPGSGHRGAGEGG